MNASGDLTTKPERPWRYIIFSGYDADLDTALYELPDDDVVLDELDMEIFDDQFAFIEWQEFHGRGFGAATSWWADYADAVRHTKTFEGKPVWWHLVDLDTLRVVAASDDSETYH